MQLTGDTDLWQWDLGRTVAVPDGALEVHFQRKGSTKVYCTGVEDGEAEIPNCLLAKDSEITAWAWDGAKTMEAVRLHPRRRPKPDGYCTEETEVITVLTACNAAIDKVLADLTVADLGHLPLTDAQVQSAYDGGEYVEE